MYVSIGSQYGTWTMQIRYVLILLYVVMFNQLLGKGFALKWKKLYIFIKNSSPFYEHGGIALENVYPCK